MELGISTASLFGRFTTEGAIKTLDELNVETAEIFLESFCEYTKKFGKVINKNKGKVDIHSIHTLTLQFEPQLYSLNKRAMEDSFKLLDKTMACAQKINAKYYTFHGVARVKRTPMTLNFERIGNITQRIADVCLKHNVTLAYENVHWCYYNYIGFFSELKKRVPSIKGTFDIKQARQSNIFYGDYISEMANDIVTVHLSDIDENGKMCLPGKGITDFDDVFNRLYNVGFNGATLIEAYQGDYKELSELKESLNFLKDKASKYFNNIK